ncbi:MAG: adenine/guanine/hypoxanthine permease [Gaiellaceae bacterium]|jgi:AGZA family xanthine/uracil permease-like MFS transporter|nr:adenine/guanine/hypoxanthine permease [Gaiellaceae bacterium]
MSESAVRVGDTFLERRFRFAENGTTLARDTMAGVTTFIVMSYIIFVNPQILSFAGIDGLQDIGLPFNQVLAATCLVAGVMTILMGLYTNRAYAIAPGLGLNAVVAFSLVAGEGLSFPAAMGLVVVEGIAVTILVLTGMREKIMDAIPLDLKKAIAIGIGLFIAFIGLVNSGIVVKGTPVVDLARLSTWPLFVTFFGLAFTIVLRARGVRGDLLIGIVATTILATIINEAAGNDAGFVAGASWPGDVYQTPDLSLLGNFNFDAFTELAFISAVVWAFSLFLADFFDTMGTLVGVGKPAGYLDKEGRLPEIRKPLLVDSLAAVAGGAASTSSATTYIESASGVAVGGRTGWVGVVCGALFFPFMFFAPIIGMVPPQATAPALIIVGFLMMSALTEMEEEAEVEELGVAPREPRRLAGIDFSDLGIGLAAALTIMFMPFTFSITDGIGIGFLAYVTVRAAQGRGREVHPFMWIASTAFLLYFLVPFLQDTFDWI